MISHSSIHTHPERAVPEEAPAIFAEALVAHVGICQEGQPFVIPMSYYYDASDPGRIYLHGSRQSRLLQTVASGSPVCIEVTLLDGLVYSKSAKYHSMNYRSAVCFGRGSAVLDRERKKEILRRGISRYFSDRMEGRDYAGATAEHLEATLLVEIQIEEWNAKARREGPRGPNDANPAFPGTSGVLTTA